MKQLKQLHERYLLTLKHADTEETIDLWFYRPVGFCVALLGERLHWTPNAITIVGIFLGIGSGLLLYPHDLCLNLLGFTLLVMADVCDSADGQLARMTKSYSRIGRILDGISSDVWFASIYLCIALRYTEVFGTNIWLLAVLAAGSHALQASMADHHRQFHLFFVNGSGGSELDTSGAMAAEYASISFTKEPLRKVFIFFYRYYTLLQELLNPQMTALRAVLKEKESLMLDKEFCQEVRRQTFPLLKWTNVLTYNWRAIALFASILIGRPWVYLICELTVFNVILIYMLTKHEIICKKIKNTLYERYNN